MARLVWAGIVVAIVLSAFAVGCFFAQNGPEGQADVEISGGDDALHDAADSRDARSAEEILSQAENVFLEFVTSRSVEERETVFEVVIAVESGVLVLRGESSSAPLLEALVLALDEAGFSELVDGVAILLGEGLGGRDFAVVNVTVADLGNAHGSIGGENTVTQARLGSVLRLLKVQDGWYLSRMQDGYLGWIACSDVTVFDRDGFEEFWKGPLGLVIAKYAEVFAAPSDGDESGASGNGGGQTGNCLVQGTLLPIDEVSEDFTRLRMPDGSDVWVRSSCVAHASADGPKEAESIVGIATDLLGLPYLWGGTTPLGFDCSGFTQHVFAMNGYSLRRDADLQYEQGEQIDCREILEPGDLVFFETYKIGPSHVGIYLGDARFIHAGSAGVAVSSFDHASPDYSQTLDEAYLGARRIIPR